MTDKSINFMNDLNLLFKYLDENGGQYICFILGHHTETNNMGSVVMENLELQNLVQVVKPINMVIQKNIRENTCDCEVCTKSIETLKNYIKINNDD